jgi:hypothetical protein
MGSAHFLMKRLQHVGKLSELCTEGAMHPPHRAAGDPLGA